MCTQGYTGSPSSIKVIIRHYDKSSFIIQGYNGRSDQGVGSLWTAIGY